MTRCYEFYCLIEKQPEGCEEMCRTTSWRVKKYMKAMKGADVLFSNTPDDKDLFLTKQLEIGTEDAFHVQELKQQEPAWKRLYNVWSFDKRDPRFGEANYEWGIIAGQIVQNLLYYYTEEGDEVLDPMAGTGTTIDVCEHMNRECRAYDISPTRPDIIGNDITQGLPEVSGGSDITLTYTLIIGLGVGVPYLLRLFGYM